MRVTTTPRRTTPFLTGLATILLVLASALSVFLAVGTVVGFGPNGDEVGVEADLDAEQALVLPDGMQVAEDASVLVRVQDADPSTVRWWVARDLVPVVLVVIGLWLLRQILRSVRDGEPFQAANVQRLRTLAAVIIAGAPIAALVSSYCASEVAERVGLDGGGVQLTLPGEAMVAGLVVLVLAEVFATGVRLRDDLEGTV